MERASLQASSYSIMKFTLLVFLLSQSISASYAQTRFYYPGNVTLGVLIPVHFQKTRNTCGKLDEFALGYVEAISYAIERINNDSDLLPNITLGLDVYDYCYSRSLAMKWAHKMVTNNHRNDLMHTRGITLGNITAPVVAVVGPFDSGSTTDVASLFQVVDIPVVSPFATSEELSSPYYTTFFRTIPPDGQQAKAMADVIEHFNWTYVAAVGYDDSYGQYGVRALEREAYTRKSFCLAFVDYFTRSGYKGKTETIIAKLKRESQIQVIVVWSNPDPAKIFLEEATKQELFGRTFVLSDAIATVGVQLLEKYSSVVRDSLAYMSYMYGDLALEKHLNSLTPKKTTERGSNPWWEEFWNNEFNCSSYSLKTKYAVCDQSVKVTKSAFVKLYSAYTQYVTDAVYAIAHALDSLTKCGLDKNAHSSRHGCPHIYATIKPRDVLRYLRNVTFQGVTGKVHFTDSGNPTIAHYDLMNFQKSNKTEKIFIAKIGWWKNDFELMPKFQVNDSLIRWNTEHNDVPLSVCSEPCSAGFQQTTATYCCWECFPCHEGYVNPFPGSPNCSKCPTEQMSNSGNTQCVDLPVVNINWKDTTAVTVLGLTAIGCVSNLVIVGVFIKYQNTPVVKGSNRELSYLLLVIISLLFVLPILHLAYPTDNLCYVLEPWRYITCTSYVSVLFLKTNRLVRAFQTDVIPPWFKKYIIHRKRQFVVVFFLNVIQIILTGLWLGLDPPHKHEDIKAQQYIFVMCLPFKTDIGLVLRAMMFGYFIFLSLLCTLYAFKARRLPENFNEARYIGFSMYVLLLSWVAYYPVDSALEGSYVTIVACATALVTAYGLLGCMFFPKVFVILKHLEQNTVDSVKAEVGHFPTSATVKVRPSS